MTLEDRMKNNYESRYRIKLTRRTPVIIRLDGKAFHSLTRGFNKPFDNAISNGMINAGLRTLREIQGSKCAYIQSDEISILVTDFDKFVTEAWFDYNLQKIVSISAAVMSVAFSSEIDKFALFDARAFNLPKEEVVNYFIWRQKDWIKNSVQMLARSVFSHKQLYNKKINDMLEMLKEKSLDWNDLEPRWKNGVFIYKKEKFEITDEAFFTEEKWRSVINQYLYEVEI